MKKLSKPLLALGAAAGTVAAAAATVVALRENHKLTVASHTLTLADLPAAFDGLRILHLSDLHTASFGKDQKQLLKVVDSLEADLVLITGDLIDRRRTVTEDDMRPALVLLSELAKRLPTVRVDGNHEPKSPAGARFATLAARTGVQNVTGRGITVRRGNDALVLCGIPDIVTVDYDEDKWKAQLRTVCAPYAKQFRIALSHRPQFLSVYADEHLDLVLCGHAHGGQVRLPFVGGLYAPEQGILPRLTAGVHTDRATTMVISRGLGNSGFPQRFNNRPEIGLLTLKRKNV